MILQNNHGCNCHSHAQKGCDCVNNCIKITMDQNCNLVIEDNSFDPDYVQVFIIKHSTSQGEDSQKIIVRDRRDTPVVFPNAPDGLYSIYKLTIPLDETMPYCYKDGKYYKNNQELCVEDIVKAIEEVSLQELIDVNPKVSEIKFDYYYYFSTCNLRKCFIQICKDILNQKASACNPNPDASLTYKRDLLWTALNVIKYMTEMGQYDEALRLLEEITTCNGLCPPSKTCKCGCGR